MIITSAAFLLALGSLLSELPLTQGLRLPKIFTNHMVLQASPFVSSIWGYTEGQTESVTIKIECQDSLIDTVNIEPVDGEFYHNFPMVESGKICYITVSQGESLIQVNDVLFGDVWVCSGQSNMEWPMNAILNSQAEINATVDYSRIRMFKISHSTSSNPQDEIPQGPYSWTTTDNTDAVSGFSALCLLYARYLTDNFPSGKSFGLIQTAWSGTRIEPWSTPEGLSSCKVPPYTNEQIPEQSNSHLFNAMIHPFLKFTIYGVIWYQGSSNTDWNKELYSCTFPAMISEWRRLWSEHSSTSPNFPFGFGQLSAWKPNYSGSEFPEIRWHQTTDLGYVPNKNMQGVFMSVSLDTYDAETGIHPRNKQLASKRLSIAAMNVAYGQTEFSTNGPFPTNVEIKDDGVFKTAKITFDEKFVFDVKESNGFYVCCDVNNFDECDSKNAWQQRVLDVQQDSENSLLVNFDNCGVGLAYLWNETPVLGTEALPIYSSNNFKLPAAPWKVPVKLAK